MQTPFIQITDSGASILHQKPPGATPPVPLGDAAVNVAVYPDLTLELFGHGFTVKTKLSPDAVCGLIGLLNFALRDHLHDKRVN